MPLDPGAQIGRYRIAARLGGGGMGEVYRARDTSLDRDVALKIISAAQSAASDAAKRFAREAQAASALNHPNIVTVFDAGESEAGPFLVMELIAGRTLRSILRSSFGTAAVIDIGRQIARALAAAHGAGIIHRDIKPENVMVRDDGYVKVLDFGLARMPRRGGDDTDTTDAHTTDASTGGHTLNTGTAVIGTAAYMAPEQARGDRITTATDVFALGLVFYELATGCHPFAGGGSSLATVARMLSGTIAPPSQMNPEVPPALDSLIVRMLQRDAALRPAASDVDRALAALGGGPIAATVRVEVEGTHVVGREDVSGELLRAFEEAAAGRGRIVALAGEPGLGKTAIAERFLLTVSASRPCLVARGRCSERQASAAAYLPWLELLDSMRGRTGSMVGELLKAAAPTWHAQVAPLHTEDSLEGRALTVNRGGSQQWMKRELASFLEDAARHAPLVLFIDDLHWADASTIDLLDYLAPRLAAARALVIVTYRPSDLARSSHPFLPVKLDLEGRGLLRELPLGSLTRADVEQYLSLEFPGHRFPAALASFLYAKTEGLPLFMADAVRTLRDRGVIAREGDTFHLTQPVAEFRHDIPRSIRSLIDLTIARLDDDERRVLVAGAVQGVGFDTATIARALAVEQADVEDRLAVVVRRHALVRPVREFEFPDRTITVTYRFVHALYQNALYASLGPSRRASVSAAVAAATLAAWRDQANTRAAELAYLFEAARDFSRAAEYFLIASDRARQIFADREALALAKRGMEMLRALPPSRDRDVRELGHLMGIALPMHNLVGIAAPELEDTYARAQQLCTELGEHPQLQFGVVTAIGAFHFMRGELRRAVASTEVMTRFADAAGDPVMRLWAAWSFGAVNGHLGERLPECLARLDEGAQLYDRAMHPAFMLRTGFDAGIGCRFQGARVAWLLGDRDGAFGRADQAVAQADAVRHPLMRAWALLFRAWVAQHDHDAERALPDAREALALAEQYGHPHLEAWASVTAGWATALTGDRSAGERLIRRGLGMVEGIRLTRPGALAALAEVELLQGRPDAALKTLVAAEETAHRTEERCNLPEILRVKAVTFLQQVRGRKTAEDILHQALAMAREQGSRPYVARIVESLRQV